MRPCPCSRSPQAKSPKEPPKKKKKKGPTEWWLPEGYAVQEQLPPQEQIEFGNEAGDALVGRKIMFNWDGVGWCEGLIEARNDEKRFRIDGDFVNFWVRAMGSWSWPLHAHHLPLCASSAAPTPTLDRCRRPSLGHAALRPRRSITRSTIISHGTT